MVREWTAREVAALRELHEAVGDLLSARRSWDVVRTPSHILIFRLTDAHHVVDVMVVDGFCQAGLRRCRGVSKALEHKSITQASTVDEERALT
jgi:hypothetical protein